VVNLEGHGLYQYNLFYLLAVAVSYSTAHPTEDADSRTLYVTNVGIYVFSSTLLFHAIRLFYLSWSNCLKVHFAATKDSLSRHFNKFGAVLKVVIVTNAATGQPTGLVFLMLIAADTIFYHVILSLYENKTLI
jgi:RNA recognition motif-containing protein